MNQGLNSIFELNTIRSPNLVKYGSGAVKAIPEYIENNGYNNVFVITDKNILKTGAIEPALEKLHASDVSVYIFDEVVAEPKLRTVEKAARHLEKERTDLVVGIGGGSCLDVAKLASVLSEYDMSVRDMTGMDNVPGSGLPLLLLPTTAGTGSEVTHIGVFSDGENEGNKTVAYSDYLFSDISIVDPDLTKTLPKPVAAATGMDALTHAIESYTSTERTPFSDMLARRSIELIGENLRQAVHQGKENPEARYNMMLASTLAGQAFVNSGLGAVHALTYPLGINYGVGHGRANAILLPYVMDYNVPAERERFGEIFNLIDGRSGSSIPQAELAGKSVTAVFSLNDDIGIPRKIGDIANSDNPDFQSFAGIAIEYSQHNLDHNPRSIDKDDILGIFEEAY